MNSNKKKTVHAELKGLIASRFDIIKSDIGIQNDAEVIRFLIQNYYKNILTKEKIKAIKEVERDKEIIDRFMEKHGKEWNQLGEDD
ncbi:MAG: hypothetical protein ACTSVI_12535 [Promethearchaeota archaeon]